MQRAAAFDPDRYPRTYKPWIVLRIAVSLLAALVALGCAAAFAASLRDPGLWLLVAAIAVGILVLMWRRRVVLTPTGIETHGLVTRRVLRSDIAGIRRIARSAYGMRTRAYVLQLHGRPRPFVLSFAFSEDEAFRHWFAGLPDSDAIELARARQEIAADETLGPTPALRLEAAARAKRTAAWLVAAATATTAWTVIYPHPRAPLLLLDAAWVPVAILVCALSRGRFILSGRRNSGRGDLSFVLAASVFSLGFRALQDVALVSYLPLVVPSLAAGIAIGLVAFAATRDGTSAPGHPLFNWIVFTLYAAGALTLANEELDRTPGTSLLAKIVHARKTSGRHASAYFTLSQVPADVDSPEVEVSFGLYRRQQVGDDVCLTERDGAFGWHWIQVAQAAACPARRGVAVTRIRPERT